MNLVVDFGNTTAKAGVFEGTEMKEVYDRQSLEDVQQLVSGSTFKNIFVSSVGPSKEIISEKLQGPISFLSPGVRLPFTNKYKTPDTLGLDRIAAAAGAVELFPQSACLVIDVGTCITYDFVDGNNNYLGGGISPGQDIRFRALHSFTAGLPLVSPQEHNELQLIGDTTNTSILSGVMNGIEAEINGIIHMYYDNYGHLQIILCGGGAKSFEKNLKGAIFAAPHLVLIGLNRILTDNAS